MQTPATTVSDLSQVHQAIAGARTALSAVFPPLETLCTVLTTHLNQLHERQMQCEQAHRQTRERLEEISRYVGMPVAKGGASHDVKAEAVLETTAKNATEIESDRRDDGAALNFDSDTPTQPPSPACIPNAPAYSKAGGDRPRKLVFSPAMNDQGNQLQELKRHSQMKMEKSRYASFESASTRSPSATYNPPIPDIPKRADDCPQQLFTTPAASSRGSRFQNGTVGKDSLYTLFGALPKGQRAAVPLELTLSPCDTPATVDSKAKADGPRNRVTTPAASSEGSRLKKVKRRTKRKSKDSLEAVREEKAENSWVSIRTPLGAIDANIPEKRRKISEKKKQGSFLPEATRPESKGLSIRGFKSASHVARAVEECRRLQDEKKECNYKETVRGKERLAFKAKACVECEEFLRKEAQGHDNPEEAYERMVQKSCRHREKFERPNTPDHYWDLSFDDTPTQSPGISPRVT